MDGLETLARIQEIPFEDRPVVVMISGHGTIETAVRATKLGAFDFLEKPLTLQKIAVVTKNAIEHRRLELENTRLRGQTRRRSTAFIGDSVPMKALRQQLPLMAATNGRVSDLRRERDGQRTGGACDARDESAGVAGHCGSELRGHSGGPDRERTVRACEGQLQRRAGRQDRQVSEGRWRARFFWTKWAT